MDSLEAKSLTDIETPATLQKRNVRRLQSCLYTLDAIEKSLFDPVTPDDRADLLVLAENIAATAIAIAHETRDFAWQELDELEDAQD